MTQSLIAFLAAAFLLTITPGVDTALVLRAATMEGARRGILAALGIALGCLAWGAAVALGLGAVLAASQLAFDILKWAGAAYLFWLGLRLILKPRHSFDEREETGGRHDWFWCGFFGNLLNPKVGIFYVSLLPQFVPQGFAVAGYTFLLACLHVAMGLVWCATLILASRPLGRLLCRPAIIRTMDRVTGGLFIAFGVRLALSQR